MTKQEFYQELKRIGVDITDPAQMKIWSLALLAMGQEMINTRFERCEACFYNTKAMVEGKINIDRCPNQFCPVKGIPNTASAAVEYIFKRDTPINMSAFFQTYVSPIVDKLIEKEKAENARNQNSSSGGSNQDRPVHRK